MGRRLRDNNERIHQRPIGLFQRQWDYLLEYPSMNISQTLRELFDEHIIKPTKPQYLSNETKTE